MKCAKDFRAIARTALSGHWPSAVLAGFLAALFGGTILNGTSSSGGTAASSSSEVPLEEVLASVEASPALAGFLITILGIIAIFSLISLVVGGAVSMGYAKYNLNLVDGNPARIEDLASQMNRLGEGFVMRFMSGIFILLWSLLLIIPGIVASFSYAMAPYILYENPGMRPMEAIKASKELMRGNKWRLFCLGFSFIGWALLSVLTLGIGNLFLRPYMEAAGAAFYRDIKAASQSNDAVYGEYTVVE